MLIPEAQLSGNISEKLKKEIILNFAQFIKGKTYSLQTFQFAQIPQEAAEGISKKICELFMHFCRNFQTIPKKMLKNVPRRAYRNSFLIGSLDVRLVASVA